MPLLPDYLAWLRWAEGTGPVRDGRYFPYRDTKGKLSIGVGRNLDDRGISAAEKDYLLISDAIEAIQHLSAYIPFWQRLDDVRRLVLADLYFNMRLGSPAAFIREFDPTLKIIAAGNFGAAAERMKKWKWYRDVGPRRADPLIEMMRSGVFCIPKGESPKKINPVEGRKKR